MIHSKTNGFEAWYEYDSKGNVILSKSYKLWLWYEYEYDSKGNEIHYKDTNGVENWYEYTFWDNGKVKTKTEYKAF